MREPTWKETLRAFGKMTRDKLEPMKRAMIEVCKEKERKDGKS